MKWPVGMCGFDILCERRATDFEAPKWSKGFVGTHCVNEFNPSPSNTRSFQQINLFFLIPVLNDYQSIDVRWLPFPWKDTCERENKNILPDRILPKFWFRKIRRSTNFMYLFVSRDRHKQVQGRGRWESPHSPRECYLGEKGWKTGFEALKLRNGRSGRRTCRTSNSMYSANIIKFLNVAWRTQCLS